MVLLVVFLIEGDVRLVGVHDDGFVHHFEDDVESDLG